MPSRRAALLQGTLDLLILKALFTGELHRLEEAGWLAAKWDASDNNRRAKYYALTKTGRRQLTEEAANWNRIALAMARALEA